MQPPPPKRTKAAMHAKFNSSTAAPAASCSVSAGTSSAASRDTTGLAAAQEPLPLQLPAVAAVRQLKLAAGPAAAAVHRFERSPVRGGGVPNLPAEVQHVAGRGEA